MKPQLFTGERQNPLECMAQMVLDYKMMGWQEGHYKENILYETNLLRDYTGTCIIPYSGEWTTLTCKTWVGFKAELQNKIRSN